ncbi:hypothetical protein IU487_33660 [Nocardia puris]|uniref:SCO6880 family protein n=1 Tax=Nocardia puris TaxID=208602 RepID=UPI0018957651|nr:SCO6880 family protein [Nocardia puris]MBF6215948.1 hypothetical protein [Nocardia puris]
MTTERLYGRWERPRSAGFFGLTWGATLLGLGLVIMIMVTVMVTRSIAVVAVVVAAAAAAFVPTVVTVGGRTVWEMASLRTQFALARARGETEYRAGRFSRVPGAARLPGLLASSRLVEFETPGGYRFGMIHLPRLHHYSVVFRVQPQGQDLVDQAQIDAWVAGYGQLLAAAGRDGEVVAITSVVESVVETHLRHRREVAQMVRPDAPEVARTVAQQAAALGGIGIRTEARIAVTWRAIGRGRHDVAEQAREVATRVQAVLSDLANAGLPATPMPAWEVTALVRSRYDLAAQTDIEAAGPASNLSWTSAGPVAQSEQWGHLVHDGARSITWEMDAAPAGPVTETVLAALLRPRTDVPRKRIAVHYRPHPADEAVDIVDSDYRDALAASQTERGIASAAASIRVDNTGAARREQALGAGLVRFGLLITVSDRADADMPGIEPTIQAMATAARLGVRRCYGSQAAAFAAGLGVGVVLPEHATIRKRLSS